VRAAVTLVGGMLEGEKVFSVILLAGDRASDSLANISPCNRKALLNINGKPMILHVLDTLMSSARVGSVAVVGNRVNEIEKYPPVDAWRRSISHKDRVRFIEGENSPATSVVSALKTLSLPMPVLITTADNPLLTEQTLDTFCETAVNLDNVDVAVGLATEQDILTAFPNSRRTFIRLKGEGYSGCNLFALMSKEASRAAEIWCDVERRRKRPWQLISYFGLSTLFKALMGRLDRDGAFQAVSRFMRLRVNAVVLRDPSAAMDVDRPEHVLIAEGVLAKRAGAPALTPS
jgi:CTP:molybdopterin cytidylyltransferase MocA